MSTSQTKGSVSDRDRVARVNAMALRGFVAIALTFAVAPAAMAACGKPYRAPAKPYSPRAEAALVRLNDLRQKLFSSPFVRGNYDVVTFYASRSREATEPRLIQLFSRVANDQFTRLVLIDVQFRRGWANELVQDDAAALELELKAKLCKIDLDNHTWLKADLARNGWYRISTAGEDADRAAFLLTQHSDEDFHFQQQVLTMLKPLVREGETAKSTFAYIFDRVAINNHLRQRYGTQGKCSAPGQWTPYEIESPSQVDRRRSEMGLPAMSDYIAGFVKICP